MAGTADEKASVGGGGRKRDLEEKGKGAKGQAPSSLLQKKGLSQARAMRLQGPEKRGCTGPKGRLEGRGESMSHNDQARGGSAKRS